MEAIVLSKNQRKPFQGVGNIIRFNWHFYILAIIMILLMYAISLFVSNFLRNLLYIGVFLAIASTFITLAVSYYIYDYSRLYHLDWIENLNFPSGKTLELINIHAGFDETSDLLAQKFPTANLQVFDFYDAAKHTEISIERARKAYPPYPNTQKITTQNLPLVAHSIDAIFLILAAHEIRNTIEREVFLQNLSNSLTENGYVVVVEHLRDLPNFLAYHIGFLHFISKKEWLQNFQKSQLQLLHEIKITPFISTFILTKHGNTP